MKTKLMKLNLSEKLADQILEVFNNYKRTLKQYDKPKGKIHFHDNIYEIESQAKKLKKKLEKLTTFEKQIFNHYVNIFELKTSLIRLEIACQESKNKNFRFSRKKPLLLSFGVEIKQILEVNEIAVTKYRQNIFCKILDVLFNELEDSEASFNLLRQILLSNIPS